MLDNEDKEELSIFELSEPHEVLNVSDEEPQPLRINIVYEVVFWFKMYVFAYFVRINKKYTFCMDICQQPWGWGIFKPPELTAASLACS